MASINNPPKYHYNNDSGCDLCCIEDLYLPSHTIRKIGTGFRLCMPNSIYKDDERFIIEAQIRSKSGLSANHGIIVHDSPATIDNGYTGEIFVTLYNTGNESYHFKMGDKIAQLVFVPIFNPKYVILNRVDEFINIDDKERGENGFGSTGKRVI
jgi:dUTP pyrophosphatase